MTCTVRSAAVLAFACLSLPAASATPSPQEKQDHPLFTRMPGFHIAASEEKEFESYEFPTGRTGDQRTPVEGKFTKLDYRLDKGATKPSALQVIANYTAAVGKIGGTVVFQDKSRATMKVTRDGQEAWAFVNAGAGGSIINLVVVERSVMAQKVMASADIFANDIAASGHVAVYGIYFDVGKADIKPESDAAIGEIAKLLAQSGALKLHVVGHTDNVGDRQMNMTLSRSRAEAVMKVLVTKHGIAASRLSATGVGPYAPVASNRTEDGRARNRRVELVEQ
jgi:outer membrane protein OmpA-like peptidoglycan-associated protein